LQQVVNGLAIAGLTTLLTARIASRAATAPQGLDAGSMALSFGDTFRTIVVVALVGAALGLLLRRNRATATSDAPDAVPDAQREAVSSSWLAD